MQGFGLRKRMETAIKLKAAIQILEFSFQGALETGAPAEVRKMF